jgi:hypothetical protein
VTYIKRHTCITWDSRQVCPGYKARPLHDEATERAQDFDTSNDICTLAIVTLVWLLKRQRLYKGVLYCRNNTGCHSTGVCLVSFTAFSAQIFTKLVISISIICHRLYRILPHYMRPLVPNFAALYAAACTEFRRIICDRLYRILPHYTRPLVPNFAALYATACTEFRRIICHRLYRISPRYMRPLVPNFADIGSV